MKIKRVHFRKMGFCRAGTMELAKCHGIDFHELWYGEGIDEEIIRQTGDDRAEEIISLAYETDGGNDNAIRRR